MSYLRENSGKIFTGLGCPLPKILKNTEDMIGLGDKETLATLIDNVISNGVNFIVTGGTTQEFNTLMYDEHTDLIKFVAECVNGRVPVLAGVGSNSTDEVLSMIEKVREMIIDNNLSIDGLLVIEPYFNQPPESGLEIHYERIKKAVKDLRLPVIYYHFPSRTGLNVSPEFILHLAEREIVDGVKWSSPDIEGLKEVIYNCPSDFIVLGGVDRLILPMMSLGLDGVISSLANVVPGEISELVGYIRKGDLRRAQMKSRKLDDLMKVLTLITPPIILKKLMKMTGLIPNDFCRGPLIVELTEIQEEIVKKVAKRHRLIDLHSA